MNIPEKGEFVIVINQNYEKNNFYLTTAIPYANADPHIGFALEILYTDVMARYQRLLGRKYIF